MWGSCWRVPDFGRCQYPGHVAGRIRINIIVLNSITHDGRNALLQSLHGDVVPLASKALIGLALSHKYPQRQISGTKKPPFGGFLFALY